KGEPGPADPAPACVEPPDARHRITAAQNGAGQDIARVMDSIVNAGEADEAGHGQHEPDAAPVIDERNHGGSEPIGGMGRGHAARMRLAEETMRIVQDPKGALPPDGLLDGAANEAIAKGYDQGQHEHADNSP